MAQLGSARALGVNEYTNQSIAITRFKLNIRIYLVRVSDDRENCGEEYKQ